jgi:hypothetical protein
VTSGRARGQMWQHRRTHDQKLRATARGNRRAVTHIGLPRRGKLRRVERHRERRAPNPAPSGTGQGADRKLGEPHGRMQGATNLQGVERSKPPKSGRTARAERVRSLATSGRRAGLGSSGSGRTTSVLAEGRSLMNPKRGVQSADGKTFGSSLKHKGPREPAKSLCRRRQAPIRSTPGAPEALRRRPTTRDAEGVDDDALQLRLSL